MAVPRHDFYQTDSQIIVSLYVKGYGAPELKDQVKIAFEALKVIIDLPVVGDEQSGQHFTLDLHGPIHPEQSSARILSSKIELKLAKVYSANWPSAIGDATKASPDQPTAGPSRPSPSSSVPPSQPATARKERRNWNKVVDTELQEDDEASKADPNAGGDAALKDFFSKLYKDADDDTRRAMIKSYTESGGTTLSTNWADIGKSKTPIHPPEGMEARKY